MAVITFTYCHGDIVISRVATISNVKDVGLQCLPGPTDDITTRPRRDSQQTLSANNNKFLLSLDRGCDNKLLHACIMN